MVSLDARQKHSGMTAEQLRKASEALSSVAQSVPAEPDVRLLTHPAELTLIRKMLELPVIIDQAVRDLAPHHLTYYARDLGSAFSQFYRDRQVLDATQPASPPPACSCAARPRSRWRGRSR